MRNPSINKSKEKQELRLPEEIMKIYTGCVQAVDRVSTPYKETEKEKDININNTNTNTISVKFSKIEELTNDHCQEIADHYQTTLRTVTDLREELKLYCAAKGKKYSNYSAALQSWLRKRLKGEYVSTNQN